jgi:hypothetical protein
MGLRIFRRIRIVPGLTLNLSKRGASVSAGVRGAHVTMGTHGTRETVGLPGTGLSYTATQAPARYGAPRAHHYIGGFIGLMLILGLILVFIAR